ncbi:unnamed protein product [Alternaria alternata]
MDLHRSNKALVKRVETLLQKTLIGCVLVILPTAGNLAAICILVGKELAFICLTLCTFDVTWAAIVFHWLTIVGTDENEGATPAAGKVAANSPDYLCNHKRNLYERSRSCSHQPT